MRDDGVLGALKTSARAGPACSMTGIVHHDNLFVRQRKRLACPWVTWMNLIPALLCRVAQFGPHLPQETDQALTAGSSSNKDLRAGDQRARQCERAALPSGQCGKAGGLQGRSVDQFPTSRPLLARRFLGIDALHLKGLKATLSSTLRCENSA